MTSYNDLPTRVQLERLLDHRGDASVSIYLPTSRSPRKGTPPHWPWLSWAPRRAGNSTTVPSPATSN